MPFLKLFLKKCRMGKSLGSSDVASRFYVKPPDDSQLMTLTFIEASRWPKARAIWGLGRLSSDAKLRRYSSVESVEPLRSLLHRIHNLSKFTLRKLLERANITPGPTHTGSSTHGASAEVGSSYQGKNESQTGPVILLPRDVVRCLQAISKLPCALSPDPTGTVAGLVYSLRTVLQHYFHRNCLSESLLASAIYAHANLLERTSWSSIPSDEPTTEFLLAACQKRQSKFWAQQLPFAFESMERLGSLSVNSTVQEQIKSFGESSVVTCFQRLGCSIVPLARSIAVGALSQPGVELRNLKGLIRARLQDLLKEFKMYKELGCSSVVSDFFFLTSAGHVSDLNCAVNLVTLLDLTSGHGKERLCLHEAQKLRIMLSILKHQALGTGLKVAAASGGRLQVAKDIELLAATYEIPVPKDLIFSEEAKMHGLRVDYFASEPLYLYRDLNSSLPSDLRGMLAPTSCCGFVLPLANVAAKVYLTPTDLSLSERALSTGERPSLASTSVLLQSERSFLRGLRSRVLAAEGWTEIKLSLGVKLDPDHECSQSLERVRDILQSRHETNLAVSEAVPLTARPLSDSPAKPSRVVMKPRKARFVPEFVTHKEAPVGLESLRSKYAKAQSTLKLVDVTRYKRDKRFLVHSH